MKARETTLQPILWAAARHAAPAKIDSLKGRFEPAETLADRFRLFKPREYLEKIELTRRTDEAKALDSPFLVRNMAEAPAVLSYGTEARKQWHDHHSLLTAFKKGDAGSETAEKLAKRI